MTVEFFVFADSREAVGGDAPIHGVRPGDYPELEQFLNMQNWEHPTLVLYREEGDTRWSFVVRSRRQVNDEEADWPHAGDGRALRGAVAGL